MTSLHCPEWTVDKVSFLLQNSGNVKVMLFTLYWLCVESCDFLRAMTQFVFDSASYVHFVC